MIRRSSPVKAAFKSSGVPNSRYGISSKCTRVLYKIGDNLCRFSCAFDRTISNCKGRIGLVIIEHEQELVGHRWQFAFGAPSRFTPARAGFAPCFIRVLLCGLVEVTEDGQQLVELGLGQAG